MAQPKGLRFDSSMTEHRCVRDFLLALLLGVGLTIGFEALSRATVASSAPASPPAQQVEEPIPAGDYAY
jgi:hypothetical protein